MKASRIALLMTRWTARATGLLLAGLVLLLHIGEGPPPLRVMVSPIHLGMMAAIAGALLGWKWEGVGAAVVLSGCALMYGYELIAWGKWLGGAFPLFFVPGILLLLAWWQDLRRRSTCAPPSSQPCPS